MSTRALLPITLALALQSCSGTSGHPAHSPASASGSGGATPNDSSVTTVESREACSFRDTYRIAGSGGMALFRDRYVLQPPDRFTKVRESFHGRDSAQSCEGTLPACESPDGLTVREVSARLTDRVVLEAWPDSGDRILGRDSRPMDGSLLRVSRDSGGSLLIGADCRGASGCTPIPAEVGALAATLGQLARQISSTEACAGLGR